MPTPTKHGPASGNRFARSSAPAAGRSSRFARGATPAGSGRVGLPATGRKPKPAPSRRGKSGGSPLDMLPFGGSKSSKSSKSSGALGALAGAIGGTKAKPSGSKGKTAGLAAAAGLAGLALKNRSKLSSKLGGGNEPSPTEQPTTPSAATPPTPGTPG